MLNFVIDSLYVVLDPRIRRARRRLTNPTRCATSSTMRRRAGMPVDAGTIEIAAVETGPEIKRRRKGLGFGAWLAIAWLVFVVGGAILAPYLPLDDPKESITAIVRKGPFAEEGTAPGHLLGGDFNGRDMLSRLLWGGRTTLVVATLSVMLGFVLGGALGLVGGYFRGQVDTVVSLVLDVFLAIPAVILALAFVTILRTQPGSEGGPGIDPELALIIAIGHRVDPGARPHHAREHPVVVGARVRARGPKAQGAKHRRIMFREVLPNVLPAMFSIALLGIAVAIVAEGTLSILGASVEADTPTWGNMIALGRSYIDEAPHIVFEPALMIFFTVLALNMLGDVVRSQASTCARVACDRSRRRADAPPAATPDAAGDRRRPCSRSTTSRRTSTPTGVSCAPSTASRSRSSAARPSASSASRARARRCSRARSWACSRSTASVRKGSITFEGTEIGDARAEGDAPATGARTWRWCSRTR